MKNTAKNTYATLREEVRASDFVLMFDGRVIPAQD